MSNDGVSGFSHFVTGMCEAGDNKHRDFPRGQIGGPVWQGRCTTWYPDPAQRTQTDVEMVNPNRPELHQFPRDPHTWRCPNCRTVYVAPYAIACTCCTVPVEQ